LVLKYIPIFTYTKSNRGFSSPPQYSTIKQCFVNSREGASGRGRGYVNDTREGEERVMTQPREGEEKATT